MCLKMQIFENEVGSGGREGEGANCQFGCQVNLHIIVGLGGMQALDSPTKTQIYKLCQDISTIQGYVPRCPRKKFPHLKPTHAILSKISICNTSFFNKVCT